MGSVVSQPNVTFSLASADSAVANAAQKVLICGQYNVAGAGVANQSWHQNIGSDGEENALFGRNSQLAAMIRAFKKITDRVQLDVIALDGSGSTKRVVDVVFSGSTATAQANFVLIAGSELNHKFTYSVPVGGTPGSVTSAFVALVNADLDCPFTAAVVSTTTLRLTCTTSGTVSLGLPVSIQGTVAGLAAADPNQTTAGSVEPASAGMFTQIGNTRYQGIVWVLNDPTTVTAHLDPLFNATNKVQDGVAFQCRHDTLSNHTGATYLANAEYNSNSLVYIADEQSAVAGSGYLGGSIAEPSYIKSTQFAAIRSLRLTPDLAISQFVTTSASLDQFGGPALASLPYFNTPLPHMSTPGSGRGWTDAEIEQLLTAGAGIVGQNPAGSAAIAGEMPTTYKTDAAGNDDVTWKFLNYVDTASGAREYFHNNVKKRFAQSRLTQGAATQGRDVANKVIIKAYLKQLYQDLSSPTYTLVQDGPESVKYFEESIVIDIAMATGKATIQAKLPILTQLRTIQATLKIDFDVKR